MSNHTPIPGLTGQDAELASGLFEYVQFLLDDDANLTPTGNLNASGRERLRARLNELLEPRQESQGELNLDISPETGTSEAGGDASGTGSTGTGGA